MATTNGYCTLAEIKKWIVLDDTIDDANLERAVNATSRAIDQYCQRHFWKVTESRVFDAASRRELKLGPFNDLVAVTSVKSDEDSDGVYETTWSASEYQPLPLQPSAAPESEPWRRLRAVGGRTFPLPVCTDRVGLVQITGEWGWSDIPDAVEQACLIRATQLLKRKYSPEGVAGFGQWGEIRISTRTDPDVASMLDPYVHPMAVRAA